MIASIRLAIGLSKRAVRRLTAAAKAAPDTPPVTADDITIVREVPPRKRPA